ncbi:DUF885 domain-containing protein [Nonomuraea cavernae]|uniref:DUF885 domain-containing protein n=1 Tax=Nonomuraea cavernae TaxID=2045107 RepID=A0A918DIN8_9ACTN|nr:DUF885 domain-containing protein [Nonomuraea cavernae]MCA2185980.1 DUF885 domain-containing protein [Nonomuraea cavernae]GGO69049.1 hypothetical protein GCM10012289_29200 [Nonomuraea cavernae]
MTDNGARARTAVDDLAETYLAQHAALDPIMATELGMAEHRTELPDLSPDGLADVSRLRRRTLAALQGVVPKDSVDRITVAALRERLRAAEELRETGAEESQLNNVNSPLQKIRLVFDLMPKETAQDWVAVADRLMRVPVTMDGYIASLRHAVWRGDGIARRQLDVGIAQCSAVFADDGFFADLAAQAGRTQGLTPALLKEVERGARVARSAYARVADALAGDLQDKAVDRDGVGQERYIRFARSSLGMSIDIDDTYAWARGELRRIDEQMKELAERITPGGSIQEAMRVLDADPARRLHGAEALRAWMQHTCDEAVVVLGAGHFDIPSPIRAVECIVVPTGGGIYYTGPSENLSRPGRVWWGVSPTATEFTTWRELSTVYHEGVPGHHLQVAQTAHRHHDLNRWRRLAWVDGHGEGWALYAERLMAELGFLDDPGDRLGMLASQAFRAVRVLIDIGMHCGLPAPAEAGGGSWTYDKAYHLLRAYSTKSEERARFEIDRYLGLPAQASSYKIGERSWLRLREAVRLREGAAFDLTAFHREALNLGGVGLSILHDAMLGEDGDERHADSSRRNVE